MRTRSILPCLLLSTTAMASDFTLTGPEVIFTGVPATFSVQGAPGQGAYGLVASRSTSTGTPFCPTALQGACLDVATPAQVVAVGRVPAAGQGTLTTTPPFGTQPGTYALQSAAIVNGSPVVSDLHYTVLVDSCSTLVDVSVEDGQTRVDVDELPLLEFASPTAHLWTIELLQGTTPVPLRTFTAGSAARSYALVVPDDALAYDTLYTLRIIDPCGQGEDRTFRTRVSPGQFGSLDGRAFSLDFTNAVYTQSLGGGSPIDLSSLSGSLAYELLATGNPTAPLVARQTRIEPVSGLPLPCVPVNEYEVEAVDANTLEIIDYDWSDSTQFPLEGASMVLTVGFTEGVLEPTSASFQGYIPIDPTACASTSGAVCGPCLNPAFPICALIGIENLGATTIQGGFEATVCPTP